jgi:hypothetical protein
MIPYNMTKIGIDQYKYFVEQQEIGMINMTDRTQVLKLYLGLCRFQINHKYIFSELPYLYICSLYDWVNSSMIYVEHCLSIETSSACPRLLSIQSQVIELFTGIIEITSSDYDDLRDLITILVALKTTLESLYPALITCPNTQNTIHINTLRVILDNISCHNN